VSGRAHLSDDRLFECYLTEHGGDRVEPVSADHLGQCPACQQRYEDLAQLWRALRDDAEADADAVFTPARLVEQQQQIARRLEHAGHPARIISFPARLAQGRIRSTASRMAPRWVAAAAGIGLFVGLSVGSVYDLRHPTARRARPVVTTRPAPAPVTTPPFAPPSLLDTDQFLSELDVALGGPRTEELMPFDALTPHVLEIRARLR
jgi:hypothetical protein